MLDLSSLNAAQLEAVAAPDGPLLVIAGAGSGKTRTIVYRLVWLADQGHPMHSMLLLTFTRKAAREMLNRASLLLDQPLAGVHGGTFHGFAFSVLRKNPPDWARAALSVMDGADSAAAVRHCREALQIARGDRSFPRVQTVLALLSKARNKETGVEEVLRREALHLLPHAEDIALLGDAYAAYRKEHSLLNYDDLLFELETVLSEKPEVLDAQRRRFRHILVDEYQDTNRVQARLVRLLAGEPDAPCNVMAVGDDAQSIYAFRGATVHNILEFPRFFPGARIVRLEENYRSVQPVLDVANSLLEDAAEGYRKTLYSKRPLPDAPAVRLYRPISDITQGRLAADRVERLLETFRHEDIAVLFRAGYQSYHLEVELNKRGVPFRKYGGLRYTEASHIRDAMAFVRLIANPLDLPAFGRVAALTGGIGPKTADRYFQLIARGDQAALKKSAVRHPEFLEDMALIDGLRALKPAPADLVAAVLTHYRPKLEALYPDDWPRRLPGLEELASIAAAYDDPDLFLADLALETPEEQEQEMRHVTLSTIHSAKGLEWSAVLILDLVEERFPSRHALARSEDFEEERRLMYVACTRARDILDLFVPLALFSRGTGGHEPAVPSPFVRILPLGEMEEFYESSAGLLARGKFAPERSVPPDFAADMAEEQPDSRAFSPFPRPEKDEFSDAGFRAAPAGHVPDNPFDPPAPDVPEDAARASCQNLGFCRHRIFGRGKIVEALPPDKYRVNFAGFGLKVILADYLSLE